MGETWADQTPADRVQLDERPHRGRHDTALAPDPDGHLVAALPGDVAARDLIAGAVVAALAVPQALGYASIAGAPVQVGLYAVPVALVAYAVFGSSRQLVVGPVSTVSVLSGSFLATFGVAGTAQAASYTAALALGSGLVLVAAGFARVGWMAEFLSKPIVTGFVLGLTILVILNELPHLLGVPSPEGLVVERVGPWARASPTGRRTS